MHIQFDELHVVDQDRAKAFYVQHFNSEVVADAPMGADGWRWIELRFPGAETNLHFIRRADDTLSTEPVTVLVNDAVAATVEALRAKGVTITSEPAEAPWQPGRVAAEFADSEGNRMVLGS